MVISSSSRKRAEEGVPKGNNSKHDPRQGDDVDSMGMSGGTGRNVANSRRPRLPEDEATDDEDEDDDDGIDRARSHPPVY